MAVFWVVAEFTNVLEALVANIVIVLMMEVASAYEPSVNVYGPTQQ